MAIEIVDFPIDSMVIFHSYVSLPEGICSNLDDLKYPHFRKPPYVFPKMEYVADNPHILPGILDIYTFILYIIYIIYII